MVICSWSSLWSRSSVRFKFPHQLRLKVYLRLRKLSKNLEMLWRLKDSSKYWKTRLNYLRMIHGARVKFMTILRKRWVNSLMKWPKDWTQSSVTRLIGIMMTRASMLMRILMKKRLVCAWPSFSLTREAHEEKEVRIETDVEERIKIGHAENVMTKTSMLMSGNRLLNAPRKSRRNSMAARLRTSPNFEQRPFQSLKLWVKMRCEGWTVPRCCTHDTKLITNTQAREQRHEQTGVKCEVMCGCHRLPQSM